MPQTLLEQAIASHEPDQTGPHFLKWLYYRLIYVYNESPDIDFVQCLKRRADKARAVIDRYNLSLKEAKINKHTIRIQALKECLEIVDAHRYKDPGSCFAEIQISSLIAVEELISSGVLNAKD